MTGQTETERLDLPTAAKRLGISQTAVHKRIARKQIRAEKVDRRWFVWLPSQTAGQGQVNNPAITQVEACLADKDKEISALRELLQRRDDELARRDRELERRDEEVHRVHVLLQQSQQLSLQLTDQRDRSKGWWRFWRR